MFNTKQTKFPFLNINGKSITVFNAFNDVDVYSENIDTISEILLGENFSTHGKSLIVIFDYSDIEKALSQLEDYGVEEDQIELMTRLASKYYNHTWLIEFDCIN